MIIISPKGWGARVDYDTWSDVPVLKDKVVVHYNGPTLSRAFDGVEAEKAILRAWEDYHIDIKGWRGVAYGWAVGMSGTVYRLRGWNTYGAHAGDVEPDGISENKEAIPVAFLIGGPQQPSPAAVVAFRSLMDMLESDGRSASPLSVLGHRDVSSTQCPGEPLYALVRRNFDRALTGEPIAGSETIQSLTARLWAEFRGAHDRFLNVIGLYYTHAKRYGIRPEVAIAQAAKETNFGKFDGVVPASFHNWCGLKTATATGDTQADHFNFGGDYNGVVAHLQHLALYAGLSSPQPPDGNVDPRHFNRLYGTARTVEQLGGKWAPALTYGTSICSDYLYPMLAFSPAPAPPELTLEQRVARLERAVFP